MLKQAFAPLVDLVYPPRCPLCGNGTGGASGLCAGCREQLHVPGDDACPLCQLPASIDPAEGSPCSACLRVRPGHDGATAATFYNEAARKLVLSFKHGGKIGLAPLLGGLITARLPQLEGRWVVVPVPLHRMKLWQRGFNQSALLAREIARTRGFDLLVDGLVRHKRTSPLGELGRVDRARMLSGAISANPRRRSDLDEAQILLVDDVLTSGATSEACVRTLRESGASKVRVACFSRVPESWS